MARPEIWERRWRHEIGFRLPLPQQGDITIQPQGQLSNPTATAANADFLKAGTQFTPQRSLRLGVRINF